MSESPPLAMVVVGFLTFDVVALVELDDAAALALAAFFLARKCVKLKNPAKQKTMASEAVSTAASHKITHAAKTS